MIKTLVRQFEYPRHGPGMMWSRMKELVEAKGVQVEARRAGCPALCGSRGG